MIINKPHPALSLKTLGFIPLSIAISLSLVACDSTKEPNKTIEVKHKVQKYRKDTVITGRVRNKKERIVTGVINATDEQGNIIASTTLQNNSNKYAVTLPKDTELPVILVYKKDQSSASKDTLLSVVIYTMIKKYDINELTTLIAKQAKKLGGYSHRNMSIAADSTVGVPDANKTSTGFRGDPTKQYGGWH